MNLTQENPKPLEVGRTLELTYSVKWDSTNISFGHRFDVYLDYPFFEHQVSGSRGGCTVDLQLPTILAISFV